MTPPLLSELNRLRSWLFVEGANQTALTNAAGNAADVLIQELEDFTPPRARAQARAMSQAVMAKWRSSGKITAVRVNPLESDGRDDLVAVMPGAPHLILLPKTTSGEQVMALDEAITQLESRHHIALGSTCIVPNIEQAQGLVRLGEIATASERTVACLVASEDMAADLGAERGPDGVELRYLRARFHLECVAHGVMSIDCPYTYSDTAGVRNETLDARRLGYRAKAAVAPEHSAIINDVLTPNRVECHRARTWITAFEAARERGEARVEVDGALVEWPGYLNAKRLIERAQALGVIAR